MEQLTAEQMLKKHENSEFDPTKYPLGYPYVSEAMKDYARQVAIQVRQKCAEKATVYGSHNTETNKTTWKVSPQSILSVDIEQFLK